VFQQKLVNNSAGSVFNSDESETFVAKMKLDSQERYTRMTSPQQ